jgi:hypothetical protein
MYCSKPDCHRKVHAKGICTTHYQAKLRANKEKVCSIKYCGAGATAFGLCNTHYKRDYDSLKTDPVEKEKYWLWVKKELRIA